MASYQSLLGSIVRYIEHGCQPGSFVQAVLLNDLKGAYGASDGESEYYLRALIQFLYNYAPGGCWGSAERVGRWMGLSQKDRAERLEIAPCWQRFKEDFNVTDQSPVGEEDNKG